ncbi:MAG TPA: BlaI/MecI/CopY family transcriptional regulator, partial [Verrucomicrobiae bacterium]
VQELLAKPMGWTYSTVRTLMDRMVAKGALRARKEGKLTIYHSAVTQEQAQRGELFYTLKHAFNGALTPMVQCLLDSNELDAEELAKIEALIKARKKSAKK